MMGHPGVPKGMDIGPGTIGPPDVTADSTSDGVGVGDGVDLRHHPDCPVRDDDSNVCRCEFLRNWDKETAEMEKKAAAPGKVVSMAVGTENKLVVLTESGELWAQRVEVVKARMASESTTQWTWDIIPGPTAENRPPPTEKESANGKEGT